MYQLYNNHPRPYQSHIQTERCNNNINSDYFGQSSLTQRSTHSRSRVKSLNRTQLSASKNKSRNRKIENVEFVQKSSIKKGKQNLKIESQMKSNKRFMKQQLCHKQLQLKKQTKITIEKYIKKMQSITKTSSKQDIDEYFGSIKNSDKITEDKMSYIQKRLEEKAYQNYKQIKKKTFSNDPEFKKKEIEEFLRRQKSMTQFFDKKSCQKIEYTLNNKLNKQNSTNLKIEKQQEGGRISQLIQDFNNYIRVSNSSIEDEQTKKNPSIIINQNHYKSSIKQLNDSKNSQILNIQSKMELVNTSANQKRQSKIDKKLTLKTQKIQSIDDLQTIILKINMHLNILQILVQFKNDSVKLDSDVKYLNYLILKKYCFQRLRVEQSFSGKISCFLLKNFQVSADTLYQNKCKYELKKLYNGIKNQNQILVDKFQTYYRDKYDITLDINNKKSNQFLNKLLIKQLNKQFLSLLSSRSKKTVSPNMNKIIVNCVQITYLIQELQGNFIKQYNQCQQITDFGIFLYQNMPTYKKEVQKYN